MSYRSRSIGLPISNGATGPQRHERVFEANNTAQLYRGVGLQPDFRYVFQPNAQANIPDAAVFGARASIEF